MPRFPSSFTFVLCLVAVAAPAATRLSHVAHADTRADDSDDSNGDADDAREIRLAKRHYKRGRKLFNLQKFERALSEFQKAYDAHPFPGFLFNIGQCQRNLGDYKAAVFSFKKFLKLDPDADNRDLVEKLIEDLQHKIDEEDTERLRLRDRDRDRDRDLEVHRDNTPTETGTRPVYKKWWFWTGVAVVGAGAVGIYAATRGSGAPDTTFGNISFRRW